MPTAVVSDHGEDRPWAVDAAEVAADEHAEGGEHAVEGVHGEVAARDLADLGDLVVVAQRRGALAQARADAGLGRQAHRSVTGLSGKAALSAASWRRRPAGSRPRR